MINEEYAWSKSHPISEKINKPGNMVIYNCYKFYYFKNIFTNVFFNIILEL